MWGKDPSNYKRPRYWQRFKRYLYERREGILFSLVALTAGPTFADWYWPNSIPPLIRNFAVIPFRVCFLISLCIGRCIVFVYSNTPDIPRDLINRETVNLCVEFVVNTPPDFDQILYFLYFLFEVSYDFVLLLLHPGDLSRCEQFFYKWMLPSTSERTTFWYGFTGLPKQVSGCPNEFFLYCLTGNVLLSSPIEEYLFYEIPWLDVSDQVWSLPAYADIFRRPFRAYLAFWLYFDILFEKFSYHPAFAENPHSYLFLFNENPYLTFRFFIFLNTLHPEWGNFVFTTNLKNELLILPTEELSYKLIYSDAYLKRVAGDKNLGTIASPPFLKIHLKL